MGIGSVMVDAVHLRESGVVIKSEVAAVVQVHPRQYSRVVVVGSVYQETTAERRRDIDLAIVEGGPIVRHTVPGLPQRLQVAVRVIHEGDDSSQGIGNR